MASTTLTHPELGTRPASAVDAVRSSLARADAVDPGLGVFLARFDQSALDRASFLDGIGATRTATTPLLGIPVAVKDIFLAAEGPTTYQSHVDFHGTRWSRAIDSAAVSRLRAAGAVVIGKTTTSEFACGPPDLHSGFPTPRNPADPSRWTGGSSAGSAAAVAAGITPLALGSDTGGSVRAPAAFCGVVGFKGTRNLIPTTGCFPLSPSLDHVGVLSADVTGSVLMTAALAPRKELMLLARRLLDTAAPSTDIWSDPPRLSVDWSVLERAADAEEAATVAHFTAVLEVLRAAGVEVAETRFPMYDELERAALVISRTEALALHSRFLADQPDNYAPATRQVLLEGLLPTATDYALASLFAVQARRVYGRHGASLGTLAMPTSLRVAPPLAGLDFHAYHTGSLTRAWNLTGSPAISLPMGSHPITGLPLGLQLVGRAGRDHELLSRALGVETVLRQSGLLDR